MTKRRVTQYNAAGGVKVARPGGYQRQWARLIGAGIWYCRGAQTVNEDALKEWRSSVAAWGSA